MKEYRKCEYFKTIMKTPGARRSCDGKCVEAQLDKYITKRGKYTWSLVRKYQLYYLNREEQIEEFRRVFSAELCDELLPNLWRYDRPYIQDLFDIFAYRYGRKRDYLLIVARFFIKLHAGCQCNHIFKTV